MLLEKELENSITKIRFSRNTRLPWKASRKVTILQVDYIEKLFRGEHYFGSIKRRGDKTTLKNYSRKCLGIR